MEYSVIIPTHNEGIQLVQTALSVLETSACCDRHREGTELIVVDDQSDDGSLDILRMCIPDDAPVQVIHGDKRLGCCGAKRLGTTAAKGRYYVFLDAHSRGSRRWMHSLEEGMERNGGPESGLYGPSIYALGAEQASMHQGQYWNTAQMNRDHLPVVAQDHQCLFICGNCMFVSRQVYEALGGFSPTIRPPWGSEDEEICLRAWRYGYHCTILPAWHMSSLYRTSFPYDVSYEQTTMNKILLALEHFEGDRLKTVLCTSLDMLEAELGSSNADSFTLGSRMGFFVAPLVDAITSTEALVRASEHKRRQKRTVDEIFEMFGMEW